ncbi:unnamed protein product, partial [Prorocentrum cordatum]
VCGSHVSGFENAPWIRSEHSRAPWAQSDMSEWSTPAWSPSSKGWPPLPSKAEPGQLLQQCLKLAGLSSDSTALELAHQFEEAAERVKPKPKAKCPYVVLREATSLCAQKQAKLAKAPKQLLAAEARSVAQEATQGGGGAGPDDYEEEDKQKLLQFQRELDDIATQPKACEQQFKELLASAKQALRAPRKRSPLRVLLLVATLLLSLLPPTRAGSTCASVGDATAFYSNITEWGPQARRFLTEKFYDHSVVALVETHHGANALPQLETDLDKDGWQLSSTPARPSGRSESGLSGGEWVLTRKFVASSSFQRMRAAARAKGRQDPCQGFAPLTLHLKTGNVVVIAADLQPGLELRGINNDIMVALASFTRALADPWLAVADWNCEPPSLVASGWAQQLQARVEAPLNCKVTCDMGPGRLYDYVLASHTCQDLSLHAAQSVPWKTHCGILITIKGAREERWVSKLVVPKALPTATRPRAQPQPDSKRQRRRAAALQRRKEALPEDLQEEFVASQAVLATSDHQEGEEVRVPFSVTEDTWLAALPALPPGPRASQPHGASLHGGVDPWHGESLYGGVDPRLFGESLPCGGVDPSCSGWE